MLDIFHIGRHEKGGMAWILDIRKKTKKIYKCSCCIDNVYCDTACNNDVIFLLVGVTGDEGSAHIENIFRNLFLLGVIKGFYP